jgi:hypothetical protein
MWWGVFAGMAIWSIFYPLIAEWRERRAAKRALADMRSRVARGDRWDTLRGRWAKHPHDTQ